MNPILKKMRYKGQSPVLLGACPPEFKAVAKNFTGKVDSQPKAQYEFILAFAKDKSEIEALAKMAQKNLVGKGIFWIAYPKGTSKKYKVEINRDSIHELMGKKGFDGVSMVALDEDWSAMRFKGK